MYWYCIVLVPYLNGRNFRTIISHPLLTPYCTLYSTVVVYLRGNVHSIASVSGRYSRHSISYSISILFYSILFYIFFAGTLLVRPKPKYTLGWISFCHSLYCVLQSSLLLPTSSESIRPRLPEMGFLFIL